MSAEPFISNDLFILYSDIVLIKIYDLFTLNTMFENFIKTNTNRNHIIIFLHLFTFQTSTFLHP
jgi:hypothetical protein